MPGHQNREDAIPKGNKVADVAAKAALQVRRVALLLWGNYFLSSEHPQYLRKEAQAQTVTEEYPLDHA